MPQSGKKGPLLTILSLNEFDMRECIHTYFLLNGRNVKTEHFPTEFFNKGLSVYEVIRIIEGTPLFLEDHIQRLKTTLQLKKLEYDLKPGYFNEQIRNLVQANDCYTGNMKILWHFCNGRFNSVFYFISHKYPAAHQYSQGVKLITVRAERNEPQAKLVNWDLRKIIDDKIANKKVFEALLINKKGFITEGSKSNIFFVSKDNIVYTAPMENVLPGITRKYVIEICHKHKIKLIEKGIPYKGIHEFEGAFITGTSPKVLPVKRIDSETYNPDIKLIKTIMGAYDKIINDYLEKENFKNEFNR